MSTPFEELCLRFETLLTQLKQAQRPKERAVILSDMAEVILELDKLLSFKIENGLFSRPTPN
jgi:hypothetical protein